MLLLLLGYLQALGHCHVSRLLFLQPANTRPNLASHLFAQCLRRRPIPPPGIPFSQFPGLTLPSLLCGSVSIPVPAAATLLTQRPILHLKTQRAGNFPGLILLDGQGEAD
jgi:hypothetical protein